MQSPIESGTLAGIGSFRCSECGYVVALEADDPLPACPACGGVAYRRASMFSGRGPQAEPATEPSAADDEWVEEARERIEEPGLYLAYEDGERVEIVAITREWTRIGRSLAADVRFDDPTVSRRHALIVRQPDGVRVLDDRSLNGVFVNGERVEWSPLSDGDHILVGSHALRFIAVGGDAETVLLGGGSAGAGA